MKINELIENIKNTQSIEGVEVVQQIPLFIKKSLVDFVMYHSVLLDDQADMMVKDVIIQELVLTLAKVVQLTNIEIDFRDENDDIDYEKAFEAYDQLIEFGILSYVEKQLLNDDLQYLVAVTAENKVNTYNSIGGVLKRTLDGVVKMIPSEEKIGSLISELPGLVDKLAQNKDAMDLIGKVMGESKVVKRGKKKAVDE